MRSISVDSENYNPTAKKLATDSGPSGKSQLSAPTPATASTPINGVSDKSQIEGAYATVGKVTPSGSHYVNVTPVTYDTSSKEEKLVRENNDGEDEKSSIKFLRPHERSRASTSTSSEDGRMSVDNKSSAEDTRISTEISGGGMDFDSQRNSQPKGTLVLYIDDLSVCACSTDPSPFPKTCVEMQ